jgi:hypothetical protein
MRLYPVALISSIVILGNSGMGAKFAAPLVCVATAMVVLMSRAKLPTNVAVLTMGCATLATVTLVVSHGINTAAVLASGATFLVWCRIVSRFKADALATP